MGNRQERNWLSSRFSNESEMLESNKYFKDKFILKTNNFKNRHT